MTNASPLEVCSEVHSGLADPDTSDNRRIPRAHQASRWPKERGTPLRRGDGSYGHLVERARPIDPGITTRGYRAAAVIASSSSRICALSPVSDWRLWSGRCAVYGGSASACSWGQADLAVEFVRANVTRSAGESAPA